MEMIELSGYVADEKMAIADKYLAPQAKELSGLKDVDVQLQKDAIEELITLQRRRRESRNLRIHRRKNPIWHLRPPKLLGYHWKFPLRCTSTLPRRI
jgi:hypothetical protein